MNNVVKCTSAEETYEAIKNGDILEIYGDFSLDIQADCTIRVMGGSPRIRTFGSSSPRIYTYGSSSPYIWTYGSSSPIISTFGSSSPYIWTYGSRATQITAESSSLLVKGDVEVVSKSDLVVIRALDEMPKVMGVYKELLRLTSSNPIEWCKFFSLPIEGDFVTLYKALDENFCSTWHNFCYLPGTTPSAPDWDPSIECGGGLHFSPSPRMAKQFNPTAKKYVACKLKLSEVIVHLDGVYPEKVKAPRVYEIFEVDIEGKRS